MKTIQELPPKPWSKEQLHQRFTDSWEALGCYLGDHESGLKLQAYLDQGNDPEYFEEAVLLPDGSSLSICTNSSMFIAKELGEGDQYGFGNEDNPQVTDRDVLSGDGHDFIVVASRFIVDPWYKFACGNDQGVFDLQDPDDLARIRSVYGSPETWSYRDPKTYRFISPGDSCYPDSKRLTLEGSNTPGTRPNKRRPEETAAPEI